MNGITNSKNRVRIGILRQHRSVIYLGIAARCDRHGSLRYLQRSVLGRHGELRRHVVAGDILHHRRAGNGVRQVAHVRAARVARRQAAHSIGVALHREAQRLEARRALGRAVIHVVRAAVRHHRDRVLLRAVFDGQFALGLRAQGVVRRHIVAAVHHLEVGAVAAVVVGVHQRAVCRRVGNRRRLAAHHVIERVGRVAVLLAAVVLDSLVSDGNRHLAGRDGPYRDMGKNMLQHFYDDSLNQKVYENSHQKPFQYFHQANIQSNNV